MENKRINPQFWNYSSDNIQGIPTHQSNQITWYSSIQGNTERIGRRLLSRLLSRGHKRFMWPVNKAATARVKTKTKGGPIDRNPRRCFGVEWSSRNHPLDRNKEKRATEQFRFPSIDTNRFDRRKQRELLVVQLIKGDTRTRARCRSQFIWPLRRVRLGCDG